MNLKVIVPPKYISPSTFKLMQQCEYMVWLLKYSGIPFLESPQTKPMAVGSAFDSFVKAEIAYLLGKHKESKNLLAELLKTVSEQHADCILVGKKLFEEYNYAGCVRRLMDDGLTDIELSSTREIFGQTVAGSEKTIGGVPVFCKPDAVIGTNTPIDWKVNGALSDTGASPKKGYLRCYKNGCDQGRHDQYGIPLEDIDKDWAIQLTFYAWVAGKLEGNLPVAIEQVAVRGAVVQFASFRTYVSDSFAQAVKAQLQDYWERFNSGVVADPVPGTWKCEPFGTPRPCTVVCKAYKATLGNAIDRSMMI